MTSQRGTTLLDLMIGLTITGVILTSALGVVVRHRRLYTNITDAATAMGTVNHLEAALGAELFPISPSAGDLVHAGSDSLVTRSFVGVYSVCQIVSSPVSFTIRRLSQAGSLSEGDSALVYSQGSSAEIGDDFWEPIEIGAVSVSSCPEGDPGWTFAVQGLTSAEAADVPPGAPLRGFIRTSYSFAERENGWFVVRSERGRPGYTIGGPFLPPSNEETGLAFRYFDAAGQPTAVESEVTRVDVVAAAARSVSGSRGDPLPVGRTLSFTFRNN